MCLMSTYVFDVDTMCLMLTQCVWCRHNVFDVDIMCLMSTQSAWCCICPAMKWRHSVRGLCALKRPEIDTLSSVTASRDTTDSPGLTLQNKVAIGLAVSLASSLGAVGVYFRYVGECAGCTYLPYIFFSGAESSGDSAQKTATSQSGRSSSTAAADAGGSVHRKADRKAGRDAGGTRGAVAPDETGTRDGSAEAAVAVMEDEEEDKACRVQVSPDEVRVIAG